MGCFFVSSYIDGAQLREFFDSAELDTQYIGNEEYIRVGTDVSNLQYEIRGTNVEKLKIRKRSGNSMNIYCETSGEAGEVILPMFHYKWDIRLRMNMEIDIKLRMVRKMRFA